jgi:hypothetical protein
VHSKNNSFLKDIYALCAYFSKSNCVLPPQPKEAVRQLL